MSLLSAYIHIRVVLKILKYKYSSYISHQCTVLLFSRVNIYTRSWFTHRLFKRGNTMPSNALSALVYAVATVVILSASVQSLPTGQPFRSATFRDCSCLPNHLEGRLFISDIESINHDEVDWLLVIRRLQERITKQETTSGLQVLFRIDLGRGLVIFEYEETTNDRRSELRRWAVVVDLGSTSPHQPLLTAALIYKIDLDSGRVWNIGSGTIGRRGPERGRRGGHVYSVNRCPMTGAQSRPIDESSTMHVIDDKKSSLPLLLTTSSDSCLPRFLSDIARIAVAIDAGDQLERRSLDDDLVGLIELRSYIKQHNQGFRNDISNNRATAAVGLILRWLLTERNDDQPSFGGCCTPTQWQASMTKSVFYQLGNKISGTQTTVMDRVYVDHERVAIAGEFYNVINNEQVNNSTFLAVFDKEISQSVAIYLVEIETNTCTVTNFTGLSSSNRPHCFTPDIVNMTSEITMGFGTTLYGWTKTVAASDGSHNGTTNIYVSVLDGDHERQSTIERSSDATSLPTCILVSEMTQWSSSLENFSDMAVFYDPKLEVPDDVFQIPAPCNGVQPNMYPVGTLSPAAQYVLSLSSSYM